MSFGPSISTYESLVGWRYLLRVRRRPRVLLIGLAILLVGGAAAGVGYYLMNQSDGGASVYGNASPGQLLLAAGAGVAIFGGCVSLFGVLNHYMTVISAFSAFMVTIGVAEVILVLGVMNGFQADLRAKIIDTHAHVVIEAPNAHEYLSGYDALAERARGVEGVLGATPMLTTEVMISAPSNLAAVVLTGVQVKTISEANKLKTHIKDGLLEFLNDPKLFDDILALSRLDVRGLERAVEPTPAPALAALPPEHEMAFPMPTAPINAKPPAVFLGAELRRNLGLWPGERFNVVSPTGELGPEGPVPKSRPFRLAGWFESGMLEFDSKIAYASLPAVQRFMGLGDVAGSIQVRVEDLEMARPVRDRIQAALGAGVRVTDWQERNSNLFSALKLEKIAMFLVLTINILLAAFAITSTLVMTIVERKREIAILMAMGSTRRSIVRIFMWQGAFTGIVGCVLGATIGLGAGFTLSKLGLPLNENVYYISAIPVEVRVVDVVAILMVALLVSLGSTLYPALYAARLRPVEGLTGE